MIDHPLIPLDTAGEASAGKLETVTQIATRFGFREVGSEGRAGE
jgi:hypothetical protein